MAPVRVLIVDDSALIRSLLSRLLSSDPDIEVCGTEPDPYAAREAIKRLNPDVLTLDVEMPRMDGLTFLRNLMRLRPMPVLMVSSLTQNGAQVTLDALELGAVDFVAKPQMDVSRGLEELAETITSKVKTAASASVQTRAQTQPEPVSHQLKTTHGIIAIGASTGGTEAIKAVLSAFPADAPPTLLTQHIPGLFSTSFVERVDSLSAVHVKHAADGEPALRGHAYFPPGDHHLRLERSGARYVCRLDAGPKVNLHRPSVDVLFNSVAEAAGSNAAAALLTGMGADGADGLMAIRRAGGYTVAQDEATSIVWGMPGAAVGRGAAMTVQPLRSIARALLTAREDAQETAREPV
jgi:two-component system chemotaxis response regulator CheB